MTTGAMIFIGCVATVFVAFGSAAYWLAVMAETRHPSGRTEGSPRRMEHTTGSKHASGGGVTPFHEVASTDKGQHDHGA